MWHWFYANQTTMRSLWDFCETRLLSEYPNLCEMRQRFLQLGAWSHGRCAIHKLCCRRRPIAYSNFTWCVIVTKYCNINGNDEKDLSKAAKAWVNFHLKYHFVFVKILEGRLVIVHIVTAGGSDHQFRAWLQKGVHTFILQGHTTYREWGRCTSLC